MTVVAPKWLPLTSHARVRRPGRRLIGFRPVGETGKQRVARWRQEADERLLAEARRLGVGPRSALRFGSSKWYAERVKEARQLFRG